MTDVTDILFQVGEGESSAIDELLPVDQLLAVDEALESLDRQDPAAAQIVKLRYFAGFSIEEAAESLGISRATAYRHWAWSRAWLQCELDAGESPSNTKESSAKNSRNS